MLNCRKTGCNRSFCNPASVNIQKSYLNLSEGVQSNAKYFAQHLFLMCNCFAVFIAHLLNARRIERDSKIWDKNKGHVVTAVLRKKEHRHHDTSKVGVYEYEHEGKAYRYHLWRKSSRNRQFIKTSSDIL